MVLRRNSATNIVSKYVPQLDIGGLDRQNTCYRNFGIYSCILVCASWFNRRAKEIYLPKIHFFSHVWYVSEFSEQLEKRHNIQIKILFHNSKNFFVSEFDS